MADTLQAGPYGTMITPANFPQTFTYNGDNKVTKISFVNSDGVTYSQTLTYDGNNNVSAISRWSAEL